MLIYDDHLTFLLPRPTWVNDIDVTYCSSCNNLFSPLKRRHHCRNCGNIFCHDCSNRNVPLPQLGYGTKPVRVCNGCFDVAYLVTYAIDEDHGISTQIHGVRGLSELIEKDDDKDLHNMVAYGGVDALIWLCRSSKNIQIHHIITTILSMLAEKESIRPVLITKWAIPPIISLILYYTTSEAIQQKIVSFKKSPPNSIHSTSTPSLLSSSSPTSTSSDILSTESLQSIVLEIIINCTHIIYQLSKASVLSQKEIITDGVFESLLMLACFNLDSLQWEKVIVEGSNSVDEQNEQQHYLDRVKMIQTLAAKAISSISSVIHIQATIIELLQENDDKLATLLKSSNWDVKKYMAKTIAYLSLRNDKYKPNLLKGEGARALMSILVVLPQHLIDGQTKKSRSRDLAYYLSNDQPRYETNSNKKEEDYPHSNPAAVSHTCCALANFATNNESQMILTSQPHLLEYICNVAVTFPTHKEIHIHIARCLANLALYEENNELMLNTSKKLENAYNVLPTLIFMAKSSSASEVQRHVVRAIDNLSSHFPTHMSNQEIFGLAYVYIKSILKNEAEMKHVNTFERAKCILSREKQLPHLEIQIDSDEVNKVGMELEHINLSEEDPTTPIPSNLSSNEEDDINETEETNTSKKTKKASKKKNLKYN